MRIVVRKNMIIDKCRKNSNDVECPYCNQVLIEHHHHLFIIKETSAGRVNVKIHIKCFIEAVKSLDKLDKQNRITGMIREGMLTSKVTNCSICDEHLEPENRYITFDNGQRYMNGVTPNQVWTHKECLIIFKTEIENLLNKNKELKNQLLFELL